MGCTTSNCNPWSGTGVSDQKCEYHANDGNIHHYTIIKGHIKYKKQQRALLQALAGMHIILRSPIIGTGYLCDINFSNTWKWDPGESATPDMLVTALSKGKSVFLIN